MAKAKPKKVQVAETAEAPSKVKMKIFKHEPCDGHPDFGWFRYWYETEFDRATVTEVRPRGADRGLVAAQRAR